MADITKCRPQRCKLKSLCLRYTIPAGDWQSYFSKEPSAPCGTKCEMFKPKDWFICLHLFNNLLFLKKNRIKRSKIWLLLANLTARYSMFTLVTQWLAALLLQTSRLVCFYWRTCCIWRRKQRWRPLHAFERSFCRCFEIHHQHYWRPSILR